MDALTAVSGLISLAINAMQAVEKYQVVIARARAEGRDVTDDELAELRAESKALHQRALDALK